MPLVISRQHSLGDFRPSVNQFAPEFLTRLAPIEVNRGYSIRLTVIVIGYPEPDITWTLDDEEIYENDHYFFDWNDDENSHTLNIIGITRREEGVYRCIAQNELGFNSTMGFVSVKETRSRRKKKISRTPKISTILEWKSPEEREKGDMDENDMYIERNQHTWDWWNRDALSDEETPSGRGKENELPSTALPQPNVHTNSQSEEKPLANPTVNSNHSPLSAVSVGNSLPKPEPSTSNKKHGILSERQLEPIAMQRERAASEPRSMSTAKSPYRRKNSSNKPKELKAVVAENKYRKLKSFWENLGNN